MNEILRRPQWLDHSRPTPEENLALDEALLRQSDAELARDAAPDGYEWLRVWESAVPFIVLGVSGKFHREVDVDRCRRDSVPILRRASGGGTVVQGSGCLNFAVVLSLRHRPELRELHRSYAAVLEPIATTLARAIDRELADAAPARAGLCGTCDLALGDVKFSGNAQKRTRHALLHHGTLLYNFDLEQIGRYLRQPQEQPDYRADRAHADFCRNLPLTRAAVVDAVRAAWGGEAPPAGTALPDLGELVRQRYANPQWNERF